MIDLYAVVARLIDLIMQPGPQICLTLLPALVALAGWASLQDRTDDRHRAWVQVVSGVAVCAWMLLPWHPEEPEMIATNRAMTLFAFGYVMADWTREVLRSGAHPRWAHGLVLIVIIATVAMLFISARQA